MSLSVYDRVAMAYVQWLRPKGYRAVSYVTVLNTRSPEITSGDFFLMGVFMARAMDCEYAGYDAALKKFIVREQLYPESRGWIEHPFDTEDEARAWMAGLPKD